MVDRCILFYKDNRVEDLLTEIEFLRGNIAGLQDVIESRGQNDAHTPPLKGKKSLNVLTHALNLLKHRLFRR